MISRDKKPRRGFSLVEVMVAATLSLGLLTMMFAFLVPTMHASARGSVRVEMQQQAVVAMSKLADDLERSSPAGVSMNNNAAGASLPNTGTATVLNLQGNQYPPVVLAVQRLLDVSSSGVQIWDTNIYAYVWYVPSGDNSLNTPGILVRKIEQGVAGVTANAPTRLSDATLTGFTTDGAQGDILCQGVCQFVVMNGTANVGPIVSSPLTLRLLLGRNANTGANTAANSNPGATVQFNMFQEMFDIQRTVAMRNTN